MESKTMTAHPIKRRIEGEDPRQALDNTMLAEANRRASPQLTVASGFTPGVAAGICGIALLGIITFSSLAAQRRIMSPQNSPPVADSSAAAVTTPALDNSGNGQNIIPVRITEKPPVFITEQSNATAMTRDQAFAAMSANGASSVSAKRDSAAQLARLQSPAIVVDLPRNAPPSNIASAANMAKAGAQGLGQSISGDERKVARAGRLGNMAYTVAEGTVVTGTLETAIDSDLPGHVRAVVSRNISSFDGSRILIPKSSRLVGQYQSNLAIGQKRTFIIWERLIRPDGVSISLEAPGTDSLGRAGVTGKVDSHFMRRFGSALLLSVIDAGGRALSSGSNSVIIAGSASSTANTAASTLQNDINIPPTIKVGQGTAIRILLNRDLDFSGIEDGSSR
jgi:type IV secretory pathway VirB10-like protein